jgi:hypothetical protein
MLEPRFPAPSRIVTGESRRAGGNTKYSNAVGRPALVARLVALGAVLAGCGSASPGQRADGAVDTAGHDGGGATGGTLGADASIGDADPTTAEGFCRDFYTVVADLLARCDGLSAAGVETLFSDPIFCARFDASLAAHRTAFDPTSARACLSEISAQLTCDSVSPTSQPTSACDGVLTPKVPVGGACRSFSVNYLAVECVDGSYCQRGPNSSCDGTCTARTPMGAACDPLSIDPCVDGAVCDFTTNKCSPRPTPGVVNATCDGISNPCSRGLFCDLGTDGGPTGTCQTSKTSGSCVTSTECVPAERCVGPTGTKSCAAPKAVGASCTPGLNECDLFGYCGPGNKCTDAYAAIGQPCGSLGGESVSCARDAYCDAGTCRAVKQAGDPCTGNGLECGGNNGRCDATTHVCVACPY